MKRVWLVAFLAVLGSACGGRTDLGGEGVDGGVTEDGGIGLDVIGLPDSPIIKDATVIDEGPPDASTGTSIQCGTTSCDSNTEVCCITFAGQMMNEMCTDPSSCNGVALSCSSAANCPIGEVCCADFNQMMASSECRPKCMGGFQNPQLCAKDSECPSGETCRKTPFGYRVCRP